MATELTILLSGAIPLAAAVFVGWSARSGLVASKENKVSEFRQLWINSLRDELKTLLACARVVIRSAQEQRNGPVENKSMEFTPSKIQDIRYKFAESFHAIELRLNPDQEDHNELIRLLNSVKNQTQAFISDNSATPALSINAIELSVKQGAKVLKSEWITVKTGELAYRKALRLTDTFLVIFVICLLAFVIFIVNSV